jgi:hypothetical protein
VTGISIKNIAELHPVLYHMAEHGTWDSIRQHGLLSTAALLDLFGISGPDRMRIEGSRRKLPIEISRGKGRKAVIRDQGPMSDSKLAACLRDGLTPADWYRTLNGKVFFWLTQQRLETLMAAYSDRQHLVLEVDTAQLLKRYADKILLAPMNTGCTSPMAFPRGLNTFLPPHEYPFEENKKKKGGAKKAIVELTVEYSVKDISEFTTRATHRKLADGVVTITELLYER